MTTFIDALGEMCPVPNIMVRERLKTMNIGEELVLETDHHCARQTLLTEMKKLGHKATSVQVAPGVWQIRVKKGR